MNWNIQNLTFTFSMVEIIIGIIIIATTFYILGIYERKQLTNSEDGK